MPDFFFFLFNVCTHKIIRLAVFNEMVIKLRQKSFFVSRDNYLSNML